MPRTIRPLCLLGLAALLACGSVGDSQVPGDVSPPINLRDATDLSVFLCTLSEIRPTWVQALRRGHSILNPWFRLLYDTGKVRVYFGGSCLSQPAAGASGTAFEWHRLVYVHRLGGVPELPPDSLFCQLTDEPAPAPLTSSIADELSLDFLMFVLGELESPSHAAFNQVSAWFSSSQQVVLEHVEVFPTNGGKVGARLRFKDSTGSVSTEIVHTATALSIPGGFSQVSVQ